MVLVASKKFSAKQSEWLAEVRAHEQDLFKLNSHDLRNEIESLRELAISDPCQFSQSIPLILGIANQAVRRTLGWELYDEQCLAAHALIVGHVAEMQTGEGKTVSALPAALYFGIQGQGTHVATPNPYLADRDFQQLKPVFESLGLTVGLLDSDHEAVEKKQAYQADVTYGAGYQFGFDYLRDQLVLREMEQAPLGRTILDELMTGKTAATETSTRRPFASIVDEADNVLMDDASSPLVLSESQSGGAPDAEAVCLARKVALTLERDQHFLEAGPMRIELSDRGRSAVYQDAIPIPANQLTRPWPAYIETALRAEHHFHRSEQYIVDDAKVKIVDATTGRIFEDRSWQSGLQQAIEAKESVAITPEMVPLAQITRQRFYRLYSHLAGMTGTATNGVAEFKSVYGLGVTAIPLRLPSQRTIHPMRAFDGAASKWDAITQSVGEYHDRQRPVLIGTRTIAESEILAGKLESAQLSFQLLNGKQDADEADIVSRAGDRGTITIATNLAGRGTDIKLTAEVQALGGLHVIASECHESARIDRQLIGRCARQGNPGSAQTFVAADDWLIRVHGPWLAKAMKSMGHAGEIGLDLSGKILKIQSGLEQASYGRRLELLNQSDRHAMIFDRR